jgi:hypothetical protein
LANNKLRFGRGQVPGQNQVMEKTYEPKGNLPQYIGFGTRSYDVEFSDVIVTDGSDLSKHASRELPVAVTFESSDVDEAKASKQNAAAPNNDPLSHVAAADIYQRWDPAWKSQSSNKIFVTFQV